MPNQSQTARPWAKHRSEREWLDDLERRMDDGGPSRGPVTDEPLIAIRHLRARVTGLQQDLRESERDAQRAAGEAFVEGRYAEREGR